MRAAIVGAGWIAAEHAATLDRLDGVELAAVCDIDESRARELAGSAAVYTDWRKLLERESPDAVFVCTPPLVHREPAVEALDRGIHVYLEKP
ncbi:MAG: Gfo/Idh/MocA family oxidoreductase, partial [Actinobacteria bacterium]|nr:Gfo/Idh/MocA family oxidoreductase [Actinomycetota bacterium]